MITLRNDFHNTEVRLREKPSTHALGTLSAGQMRRAERVLCGMADCCCGHVRGPQGVELDVWPDGHADVYELSNGSLHEKQEGGTIKAQWGQTHNG